MEHKDGNGRYLVTSKVHWQAVYRVLVDEGWYDPLWAYERMRRVAPTLLCWWGRMKNRGKVGGVDKL